MKIDANLVISELESVFWPDGGSLKIGLNDRHRHNITHIVLVHDGHGVTGLYDRIHVLFENGKHQIFPVHNTEGFEIKRK